jgi:hypothetical protein
VIAHGGIVYIAYHAWRGSTRVTRFARLAGCPVAGARARFAVVSAAGQQ